MEHPQVEFSLKHGPKNPLGGINKQIGKGSTQTGKRCASNSPKKKVGNGTEGNSDAAGSEDEDGEAHPHPNANPESLRKVTSLLNKRAQGVTDGWSHLNHHSNGGFTKTGICWCPHKL